MMLGRMCDRVNEEADRRCQTPSSQRVINETGAAAVGGLARIATGSNTVGAAATAGVRMAAKADPQGTASTLMGPVVVAEFVGMAVLAVPYMLFKLTEAIGYYSND